MSRAQSLLFGVAVVFAGWNILNNGLSVRSGAIALLIIICLVIFTIIIRKRRSRKKPWRKSGKKKRFAVSVRKPGGSRGKNIKNNG